MAASQNLVAQNVVYKAAGTFSSPPLSGNDTFLLAGEPFSISITASEAAVPVKSGTGWAQYGGLAVSATVQSGLTPGVPITITNNHTSILLSVGNPSFDLLQVGTSAKVLNLQISFVAKVLMKKGTLTGAQILPLTHPAALTTNSASLTYSATVNGQRLSTTLGMAGSLTTTVTATTAANAASVAEVFLHSGGAQSITTRPDGTKSMRPVGGGVETGAAPDKVALQFYASGVRDASAIHVQIAGQEVRVLYAGPAGHFAGLDEVMVELPRSLAGQGDVDVTLTADGETASPVRIHIQ